LKGLRIENAYIYFIVIWNILGSFGIIYGHFVYFMAIWYILWPFGNVAVIWYIFLRFGILCQEKSGNPDIHTYVVLATTQGKT
jgi:hypothetical protein